MPANLDERLDSRILGVTLECIEDESLFMKIRLALPKDCHARFEELWRAAFHSFPDGFHSGESENDWDDFSDLSKQSEKLRKFIEDHMDKELYSDHVEVGDAAEISRSTWYKFLERAGRGNANDREYCMRMCFVLKLNKHKSQRLFELTGQPGWARKDEREFRIYKKLMEGCCDIKNVDGYLMDGGFEPLFGRKEQRKNLERINKIIDDACGKLGIQKLYEALGMSEMKWYAFRGRLGGENFYEKDKLRLKALCKVLQLSPEEARKLWELVFEHYNGSPLKEGRGVQ